MLSLPMFPHLTEKDQQRVVQEVVTALESGPKHLSAISNSQE